MRSSACVIVTTTMPPPVNTIRTCISHFKIMFIRINVGTRKSIL